MAIEVTKRWSDSRLTKGRPEGWTASESWHVSGTDSKSAAIEAAVAHAAPHDDNPLLKVYERDASSFALFHWIVTAQYKFGTQPDPSSSPFDEPTRITWEFESEMHPVERDVDNNAITNSAGSPFSPPHTEPVDFPVLVCTRPEPFFSVGTAMQYRNRVNSAAFSVAGAGGIETGQALCIDIRPVEEYTVDADLVRVRYRFKFAPGVDPWQFRPLDQGREAWWDDAGTTTKGNITAKDGGTYTPVNFDVRLDGAGVPLNASFKVTTDGKSPLAGVLVTGLLPATDISTADAKYLLWKTKKTADFMSLGL